MSRYFADTFYFVALTSPRESRHAEAVAFSSGPGLSCRFFTTEEILTEFLTFFAGKGAFWRDRAVRVVRRLREEDNVWIAPQTPESFAVGLELYADRPDKAYSLTDCISMQTMRREGLTEALTNDRHFEQEGFRAVFRT